MAPSTAYRLAKFVRRNRLPLTVATLALVLMIVGTTVSTWQALRASRNARRAQSESAAAIQARNEARQAQEEAVQAGQRERAERVRAEQLKYAADLMVAQAAIESANLQRAKDILEAMIPVDEQQQDLRGWEWYFFYEQLHSSEQVMNTHASVAKIAVSADGRRIAVAGSTTDWRQLPSGISTDQGEQTIKILKSRTLATEATLAGQLGDCEGLRFGAHDTELIVERGMVTRHHLESRAVREWQITPDLGSYLPVRLTNDSKYLLGMLEVGKDNVVEKLIRCFDAETKQEVAAAGPYLVADPFYLDREFRLSPDGEYIAVSCDRRRLRMLSVPKLEEVRVITTPGDTDSLAWSHDSQYLATGYNYPWQIDIWETTTGRHVKTLAGRQGSPVEAICFSSDGSVLAFSEAKSRVHVWDLETFTERRVLLVESPSDLSFLPSGDQLVCAGANSVRVVDVSQTPSTDLRRISLEHELWNLDFSPDGELLAVSAADGKVRLFETQTRRLIAELGPASDFAGAPQGHPHARVKFSPDGRSLIVDNNDFTVGVYDVLSRTHRFNLRHSGMVFDLDVAPDSTMFATAGIHNTAIFWEAATGEELFRITEQEDFKIDSVRFSPDSQSRLAVISGAGGGRQELSLVDLDTRTRRPAIKLPSYAWSLTFAPDGKHLYVAGIGSIDVHEMPSLRRVSTMSGGGGPIPNVTTAPDGTLALPSWGGEVQLWSPRAMAEVGVLPLPVDSMTSAKFSPDGKLLVISTLGTGDLCL